MPDVGNLEMLQSFLKYRKIFANNPELKSCLKGALVFAVTLENGTKINLSYETSANAVIAKQMLYQFQSQGLDWTRIRDDTEKDLKIIDILERCAKQKSRFKETDCDPHC